MAVPVVTSIVRQKKDVRRVSIFLDGEFAFGAHEEVVYVFRLAKGTEMTDDLRARIVAHDARMQARLLAERHLAGRMRSEHELRRYLARKDVPADTIDMLVEDLRRARLLDDEAYARAFVKDRLAFRPRAAGVLRLELQRRGVARDIAEHVTAELCGAEVGRGMAQRLAVQYLARVQSQPDDVRRRRLFAFLQRKGFDMSTIYDTMRESGFDV